MAFKKFTTAAATKTHGTEDASIVDLLMPHTELEGSSANFLRSGGYALLGWVARGKKETGSFSLS